jgi:hypothetical protein
MVPIAGNVKEVPRLFVDVEEVGEPAPPFALNVEVKIA